jgi:hypothetical protein
MRHILFRFSNRNKSKKLYSLTTCNLLDLELEYETDQNNQLTFRINAWLKDSKATSKGRNFSLRGCCCCLQPADFDVPQHQGLSNWLPRRDRDDRSDFYS